MDIATVKVSRGSYYLKPDEICYVSGDYEIGIYPVTQKEWVEIMGLNPSWFCEHGWGENAIRNIDTRQFPVENVSWLQAIDFCNVVSERQGITPYYADEFSPSYPKRVILGGVGWRLPKVAEWQLACCDGGNSFFGEGIEFFVPEPRDILSPEYANFGEYLRRPTPVGTYGANRRGIFDMHGNVWEWCEDERFTQRRVCGGSWCSPAKHCGFSEVFSLSPACRSSGVGFRLVRSR